MTTVTVIREGGHFTLAVEGHAGYARDGGPDIVCAAVSGLACTALLHMAKLGEMEYRQEPGDVWMRVKETEGTRMAMGVIVTGYEMLAEKYPGHVRMKKLF